MSKIQKKYLIASREALKNSRLWLNESNNLLFERNSYGHSCSLSLFSIEESVKSLICFFRGLGVMDQNNELLVDIFKDHYEKIETVMFIYLYFVVPILQKSLLTAISDEEIEELKSFFESIHSDFFKSIKDLLSLRMRGMYVDLIEGKIKSPYEITIEQAEGMFMNALGFYNTVKYIIKRYEEADDNERKRLLDVQKNFIEQAKKNYKKLDNYVELKY